MAHHAKETVMFGAKQISPQTGDRVQVEILGTVVALEERAGVKGALVELDGDDHEVWFPLTFLMTTGRH
jgi:hypothetical protein